MSNVAEYVPFARASSMLDQDAASKLKCKFEVAYCIWKEGLAFTKMPVMCELEEKQGVNLRVGYKIKE